MTAPRMGRLAVVCLLAAGVLLMSMPQGFPARGAAPPPGPRPPTTPPSASRPSGPRPAATRPPAHPTPPLSARPAHPPRPAPSGAPRLASRPPRPVRIAGRRRVVVRRGPTVTVVQSADQLVAVPAAASQTISATAYKVTRLDDDYTPVLAMDNQEKKVRLVGVALPDLAGAASTRYKELADRFFADLLVGEFVYLAYDPSVEQTDESDTTVAYLYRAPDGLSLNLEIVRQGFGLCETDYYFDQQQAFEFYESKAQADDKGLWALVPAAAPPPAPAAETRSAAE